MRICVLTEFFHPDMMGAAGTLLSDLCRCLKSRHPDLAIETITSTNFYRGDAPELPREDDWDGIRILRLRSPKPSRDHIWRRLLAGLYFTVCVLLKLLRQPRYDLVVVVTAPPVLPLAALLYRRLRGVPYVYLIHDLYPDVPVVLGILPATSLLARFTHACQASWLRGAARVVALGRCMKNHLQEAYRLPEDKIVVITNWAEASIVPLPADQSRFRAAHQLAGFVILYAGNLGQCQDFDTVLDAAKLLAETAPDVLFCIVGEGTKRECLDQRITAEAPANVRLFDFVPQDELSDLLGAAEALLITLEPGMEGLGVPSKFYNSLAAGKPLLAVMAPESEVARIVEEERCGLWVEYGAPAKLADAILSLRASPELREAMGRRARQVMEERYTLAHIAEQYGELLAQACPARPPGRDATGAPPR